MLNPVFSLCVYLVEMSISYIFFFSIFDQRYSATKSLLIGFFLFATASAINLIFQNNGTINLCATFLMNVFFLLLCFDANLFKSLFYATILSIINATLEVVIVFFSSFLTGSTFLDYNNRFPLLIFQAATIKTLYFLVTLILAKILHPVEYKYTFPLDFLVYPISASVCLSVFWYICSQPNITYHVQFLLAIAGITLLGSSIFLFITYSHQLKATSLSLQMESELSRLQAEQSYYQILEQQNQQLMIYAHDAKKHLAAIYSLNSDPQIENYVARLSDQLAEYTRNCHSGNKLLDVMIHKFCVECEMKNIHFEYDVKLCNLNNVKDIDLVAILGNLIDNAITAAAQSRKKTISLATAKRNSYSILVITNSCDEAPQTHGGYLITSKSDRQHHGFGLRSVKKALKKYQGDFEWEYDEDACTFAVTVMIGDPIP